MVDEKKKLAIARRQLWYWQNKGNSFSCGLYSLFEKADPINKSKLTQAFPEHAEVYYEWYYHPDPEAFLAGLNLGGRQ